MTLARLSLVSALLIGLSATAAAQDRTNTVQFKFTNSTAVKATDLHVVFDQHIQSLVTHDPATQQNPANTFPDHSGDNTVTHDLAVGVNGAGVAAGASVTLTFSWPTGKAPKVKSARWTKTNTLAPNPNDPNDWLGPEMKPTDEKNTYEWASAWGNADVKVSIDGTDHHFYSIVGDTAEQSALRFGDFINSLPFGCTLWTSGNEVAYTGLSYSPGVASIVVDVIQQDSTQFVTVTDITDALGACCSPMGCEVLTEPTCTGSGGLWMGPYTECDTNDCNQNGIADMCDIAYGISQDCNGNGIPDECDITHGTSADVDLNGVPDECQPDCNGNGIVDSCDVPDGCMVGNCAIAYPGGCGMSWDCQPNGIPDECELVGHDCNANGLPDDCDIASGRSQDVNGNGIPDECEAPVGCKGDTNCDGRVTFADIDPFVEALSGESAWNQSHPGCPWLNADCNNSGTVNFADIDPFVAVIGTTCP